MDSSTTLRRLRAAPDNAAPPATLPQFAHVSRYWDNQHKCFAARLLPGEYYVSTAHEIIATVLGSCVSACIRDTRIGVGGMNHFMLPLDTSQGTSAWGAAVSAATRYGNVAMERLINDILKLGGLLRRLRVTVWRASSSARVCGSGSVSIGLAVGVAVVLSVVLWAMAVRVARRGSWLHGRQAHAAVDLGPDRDRDLGEPAVARGRYHMLHLHRLEGDDGGAGRDGCPTRRGWR